MDKATAVYAELEGKVFGSSKELQEFAEKLVDKKILEVKIDKSIELNEKQTKGMPEDLKGHLLVTMTIASKKYKCHWSDLTWSIKFNNGQPIINVKRKL